MYSVLLIILLISIFSWHIVKLSYKGRIRWLVLIFCLLITARCLLKWETWLDLPSYADAFYILAKGTWSDFSRYGWSIEGLKAEPFWMIYNWVIASIIPNFPTLLLVTAFLTFMGYYVCIKEWINDRFWIYCVLLILIGSYSQSFYVLRQHLAIGLVLWSFSYMLKKNYVKMIVFFLLAFGFHQTAVFVAPVYFLYIFVKKSVIMFVCLGIYAVVLIYIIQIMPTIVGYYFIGLDSYAELNDEGDAVNIKMTLLQMALLLWRYLIMKKKCWNVDINRFLTLLMIIGVINSVAGTGTTTYMSRLNMYYSELSFLYVPNTLLYIKSYKLRTLFGVAYFLLMGYFTFMSLWNIPQGQNLFIG